MKKVSKAELKRRKDRRDRISHLIRTNLTEFKDTYLNDYAEYQKRVIERERSKWEKISTPELLAEYNKKAEERFNERYGNYSPNVYVPYSYRKFRPTEMSTVEWEIEKCNKKLQYSAINQLNWLTEAHEGYEKKIEKVIDKVDKYEMSTRFMKIERINNAGSDFSFLISNDDMEVHARVIYACGAINAPHYRFIVTKRNKK